MAGTTYFASPSDWGAWLAEHAAREDELWVGFWKRGSGEASISWAESVDEALCHGWIDGVRQSVDEQRYRIRFTPRRSRSKWSAKNLRRFDELEAAGRVQRPGRAAFEARAAEPAGYSYEERAAATLPEEYQHRLEANAPAWTFFQAQPPGYRQTSILWVVSAKREATRLRRLETLIEDSGNGQRIKPLRR